MKVSNFSGQYFRARLGTICWFVLPVGCAVFLVWEERSFRQQLARPASVVAAPSAMAVRAPFDATALASVFGLSASTDPQPSSEPLTLHGSFVVSQGLSKALLSDAQGSQLYQVGERLPGGSVLRRVEASQVVLWNNGREEVLTLLPPAAPLLRRFDPAVAAQSVPHPARFIRPLSGPSE